MDCGNLIKVVGNLRRNKMELITIMQQNEEAHDRIELVKKKLQRLFRDVQIKNKSLTNKLFNSNVEFT